jgi:hypothetical protein
VTGHYLLRGWRRIFYPRRSRPAGRPPGSGTWANGRDFKQAVEAAVEALEDRGKKPTQADVARILCCHPRTLARWLVEHGVSWTELVSRRPPSTRL